MMNNEPIEQLSPAKRAVYEIRQLRSRVEELERLRHEPVAIVGIGLRFPGGASTPEEFWQVLTGGVDTVKEIPSSRWSLDSYYDPDPAAPGKMDVRYASLIEDPALFDADFFGISPREAMVLDPQHRLAIEVAWEALENAGYNPTGLSKNSAGVFLALGNSDYNRLAFDDIAAIDSFTATGNVYSVAAGRISYFLGFAGPSVAIDTACSGSLVAVHLACQSLRATECKIALAGGVNLILTPEISVNLSKAHMLSKDGRCKTFDAKADGYGRGEGCGMVVLKRLSDALADGDRILALVRGSAVNQDGRSGGLTVPSGAAQEAVIRQALANAQIEPERISYVEAHGTGTSLGDPIEAHALAATLGQKRSDANPLTIGSAKTAIGHLEAAAGIAGLIKTVLAFNYQEIPPHPHFQELNPHINWNGAPVHIPVSAQPWTAGNSPRAAGVSSFGFSGTNAHVVLEEAPLHENPAASPERPLHLLALSARNETALTALQEKYASLSDNSKQDIADICYTANVGRAHFQARAAYIGASFSELLHAPIAQGSAEGAPEIVYLFSGQGSQYLGMGRELYETQPVFRAALEECASGLDSELESPLLDLLWGKSSERLQQTANTQPALFAVEYALARLWQSWGILPTAVLGHSIGEYVAACVAGLYSLEDGLKLIAARGRLMQNVSGRGGMLAVRADEAKARTAFAGLEDRVSLAAINGPASVVVSGYEDGLEAVEQRLKQAGIAVQRLAVSHGFHSPQMTAMAKDFERVVAEVNFRTPQLELISSWTGQPARFAELRQPAYWTQQITQPVRFQAAMEALRGYRVFLEIGPGTTLLNLGRQTLHETERLWLSSIARTHGEWPQMLESLAKLYVAGADIDWQAYDAPYPRRKLALPTYPFQRLPFWIQRKKSAKKIGGKSAWESAHEAAAHQSECAPFGLEVAAYPGRWNILDRLSDAFILQTLVDLGAFQSAGETHTATSLASRYGIESSYERLLGRWLSRLADSGHLLREDDRFTAPRPLPGSDLSRLRTEADVIADKDRVFLDYVLRCGENLAKILTGRMSPLQTIFPNGEFTLAEDLYERAPVAVYFRNLCRAALEGFVRAGRTENYRVLEIGAGTGSTASALLPVLPPQASEYYFTDVSDIFLNHARQKFAAYPFVRYGRLDMELDPAAQSYPEGAFDVVAATNVLHATRDIRATIRRLRSLLAPGGILIVCEATDHLPWFDVTTGLIEGWQIFEDGLRHDNPLMSPDTWKTALLDGGFAAVSIFPESGSQAEALAQRVFIAHVAGEAAQSRPALVMNPTEVAATPVQETPAVLAALLEAPPLQRHDSLVTLMRQHLAEMLRFPSPDQVDRKRRLIDLGLDSLMALEFSGRLTKALHLEKPLSSTLVFDYPTLDSLASHLEKDILRFDAPSTPSDKPAGGDADAARLKEVEQLSEEEVEALLLKKLTAL